MGRNVIPPVGTITKPANVVDGFIVDHECAVRVLQRSVRRQHRVVGLNHRRRHLGSRINGKLQLGLLSIVHRKPLHQQGGEARSGPAAEGMEDEEALEAGALISALAEAVENDVDDLLADRVMTASVVIRRILFP